MLRSQVRELSRTRIPGLDGIRALSVTLVFVSHALMHAGLLMTGTAGTLHWAYGEDGVVFFFALSGFLITTLLLRERELTGRMSLTRFYARRALRIWPVWYAYLAAVALMAAAGLFAVQTRSWLGAATYVLNLVPGHANDLAVAHGWTLAIEEQFYLIWPLTLILLFRSRTRPVVAVAALVITAPLWRTLIWIGVPVVQQFGRQGTQNRAGALLAGCLVALILTDPELRATFIRLVNPVTVMAAVALVLAEPVFEVVAGAHVTTYTIVAGLSVNEVPLAFLVGAVAVSPHARVVRALSWWPIALLGLISYSLYAWQEAFLFQPALSLAFGIPLALSAGFLSWQFIELRTQRLRGRFIRRPVRGYTAQVSTPAL